MSSYTVERSITINVPAPRVHGLVDDFRHWTERSPWEDLHPGLERTSSGPDQGVGAHYAWSGNRKAGVGSMEIMSSTPTEIVISLSLLKPSNSTSPTSCELAEAAEHTAVTWRMTGEQTGLMSVFVRFINMDKLIG